MKATGTSQSRTVTALVGCLLFGIGLGMAALGLLLWHSGRVAEGVDATAWRWTALPVLVAVFGALIWSATLAAFSATAQRIGNIGSWSLAFAALIAAGAAYWSAGPEAGDDARYPDAVTNATAFHHWAPLALVLAAAALAIGSGMGRRAMDDDLPQLAIGPRALAVLLLAGCMVAGCGVAVPRIADATTNTANLRHRIGSAAAPSGPESELTGEVAQRLPYPGAFHPRIRSTPAGLIVTRDPPAGGVELWDPVTGRTRWSWRRNDVGYGSDAIAVSADGRLIAARFESHDQYPAPPGLIILDSTTGAIRAELPAALGSPLAVSADRIVTVSPGGAELRAYDFGGDQRWTRELSNRVRNDDESQVTDDGRTLIVTVDSEQLNGQWRAAAVDLATGSIRWAHELPRGMAPLTIVEDTRLAVTGGLDLQPVSPGEKPATSRVVAYRLSDGERAWERTIANPPGTEASSEINGCSARVDVDADHLTLRSCADYSRAIRLTALRPQDGTVQWTQTIKTPRNESAPAPQGDDGLQAMPDGSTAMLGRTNDGCSIVRADRSGTRRTPVNGVDGGCEHVDWLRVGGTVLIDSPSRSELVSLR